MKKLISTLPPLTPIEAINIETGLQETEWETPVLSLLNYVKAETVRLHKENSVKLHNEFEEANNRIGSANSFARQRGYKSSYHALPREVRVKSRINELVLHKLVSEVFAFHQSTNPKKQPPAFYPKINLGAVDKQMATLSSLDSALWLEWKVWDKHLLLKFEIPSYLFSRDIVKWSLPTVQVSRRTDKPVFYFSVQEKPQTLKKNTITAGVDLGRVQPFTLAIIDEKTGRIVKKAVSRGRLRELNSKRERLITQRKQVLTKLDQYKKLGLPETTLKTEADRLKNKIRRIGHSLAQQSAADLLTHLKKYNVTVLHLENLKFVTGQKRGGRWNHAAQQNAITHTAARAGVVSKKVSPAGTSQHCHSCRTPIIHNTKKRTVRCTECKTTLDRDFNAALNVAKKQTYPHPYSKQGDDCSPSGQVMSVPIAGASRSHGSVPCKEIQLK